MDGNSFFEYYYSLKKPKWKETTEYFNSMDVMERKRFLQELSEDEEEYDYFINGIFEQAKQDFWVHEKELIKQGKGSRDWTPDQIESIMNISEKTGNTAETGGIAKDVNGRIYYGRHIRSLLCIFLYRK